MSNHLTAARLSLAAAIATLLTLAVLHLLSPEFDPSWRMVSEYANGGYGWVLSLMFASWAVSSWALAFAIWPQVGTRAGKIGLFFLIAAGIGEAMASVFDINHSLHDLAVRNNPHSRKDSDVFRRPAYNAANLDGRAQASCRSRDDMVRIFRRQVGRRHARRRIGRLQREDVARRTRPAA